MNSINIIDFNVGGLVCHLRPRVPLGQRVDGAVYNPSDYISQTLEEFFWLGLLPIPGLCSKSQQGQWNDLNG